MAITSLVLGVLGFPAVCCYGVPGIALGVTALILGRMSLGRIRASNGGLGGHGLAQAGWITGTVAGSLGLLYVLVLFGIFLIGITGVINSPTSTPSPVP